MRQLKILLTNYWLLIVFLVLKMVIQFVVVNPVYELHRDEFLYLDQANHLSAGYISVPPFLSWISSVIFFLGGSVFWIRFFPALFGAMTIFFAWLTVEELHGKIYSKILVSCALLFSVFIRLNILFQPNAFDILAWTSIFYFLIRFIRTENNKWLFYLAIAFVLGFYNKYNVLFVMVGLLVGLALTKKRTVFLNKYFYISFLLAVLLILPNLYWQVVSHFPVIHHMQALKNTQLDYTSTSGFLIDQLLFMGGSLFVVIAALVGLSAHKKFSDYRVIVIAYFVVILMYVFLKAKSYYALGLYPVLLVFGSVYLETILSSAWKKYVIILLILVNFAGFSLSYDLILPIQKPSSIIENKDKFEKVGLLKWNDGKNHHIPQDFADMQGWVEMADKSLQAYLGLPEEEKMQTLIFCDNYGQAGALNYYNRGKMPEAYSASTDYIFWIPRNKDIKNVLLVGNLPDNKIVSMFREVKLMGTVESEFAIEKNTRIYLLLGANEDFSRLFYETMDSRISNFDIF